MTRARDLSNLGSQAGSGLDASDITSGILPVGVVGGSGLNAVNPANLASGVLPVGVTGGSGLDAVGAGNLASGVLPATVTGGSGLNAVNAANIAAGVLPVGVTGGSGLNALSASNLSAGTVPDARFPATLPAASGTNLTALPAANVTGVLPVGVTGGSGLQNGITSHHRWWMNTQYYGTPAYYFGTTSHPTSRNAPVTQQHAYDFPDGGVMSVANVSDIGTWTFPSAGYWLVSFTANAQAYNRAPSDPTGVDWIFVGMHSVISGTQAYIAQKYGTLSGAGTSASHYAGLTVQTIYDVADTATHKIRFNTSSELTTYWWGDAISMYVTFIRLGDT